MEERIVSYWTKRAVDFNTVRKNELVDSIRDRWLSELLPRLPKTGRILDVGTGTGYFAILLSRLGYAVTGIDLTPAMLEEARKNCAELSLAPEFLEMDAQALTFPDGSFDAVISRNLTWTLPDPEKAYTQWLRVLKPGGVLLNFDADYARNVRNENQKASYIRPDEAYGHLGVTKELEKESAEITLSMPASRVARPLWDAELLKTLGCQEVQTDLELGKRVLREHDLPDAPMFLIMARKSHA